MNEKSLRVRTKREGIVFILLAIIFLCLSIISCQRAEEPEGKKEAQVQKQEVKQQASEAKPIKAKPEAQPKQEQPPVKSEAKEEKKEKPIEIKESPLTEEEQKEFDQIGGNLDTPTVFKNKKQALGYLKILLKGNEKTIRWYVDLVKQYGVSEARTKEKHADNICVVMEYLARKDMELSQIKDRRSLELILEVMEKKLDYPTAYACASKYIGWYATKEGRNEKAVPLLKEALKHADSEVRLEAAGSLLASGEADIALPVLDELAKQGEVRALLHLYEPEDKQKGEIRFTRLWDNRGLDIFKSAMEYPSDEVKGYAANALTKLGIEKEKAEEVSLNIIKRLMYRTEKDYGFEVINPVDNPKWVLLPGYEGKDINELQEKFSSDHRACNFAIYALGRLKSKRAVPLLKHIKEKNTDRKYGCWEYKDGPAESALERILENGGDK